MLVGEQTEENAGRSSGAYELRKKRLDSGFSVREKEKLKVPGPWIR